MSCCIELQDWPNSLVVLRMQLSFLEMSQIRGKMSCNHTNRIGHFQDALDPLSLDASFALEDLHQFRREVVHLGEELGLKGFGRDSQELCIYLKKKEK